MNHSTERPRRAVRRTGGQPITLTSVAGFAVLAIAYLLLHRIAGFERVGRDSLGNADAPNLLEQLASSAMTLLPMVLLIAGLHTLLGLERARVAMTKSGPSN